MQKDIYPLQKDIYWVGVIDQTLGVFDITEFTEFGSTYNAYLVVGSEKSAIIDTAKVNFSEDFLAKIESIIPLSKIDYLVLNHTEPDHSGSVQTLLEKNPHLTVISSAPGLSNLKEIVNLPFHSIRAKEDLEISLGDKTLTFSLQPNLHWPDTMFTYIPETHALFTCDFFGAHYAYEGVVSSVMKNADEYIGAMKYYFECLMTPFKKDVHRALDWIESKEVSFVGTSHGAVIDDRFLDQAKALYRAWAEIPARNEIPMIAIPYTSVYGYTRQMLPYVVKGVQEAFEGKVQVEVYDLVETTREDVIQAIRQSDGFLIGSTTILGDAVKPVWDLLTSLNPQIDGGKPAGVFGSYGWSGEGVKYVQDRLGQLKMKTVEPFRIRFQPSTEQLEECVAYGKSFGEFVKNQLN
ncbi:MAG: FprA family A-type flavoprotein [Candidatus Izemoplasmatales bacterium]